ncbi:MAG: gas vesicle protein GvpN [Labrys sp. (in: a-proteobacteria)]
MVTSFVDNMQAPDGNRGQAVILRERDDLFQNDEIRSIEARALRYLTAGVPVHFRGPAGTGKTTLALQAAALIGRPVIFLTGDSWLTAADLVGKEVGLRHKQVVDNFVHNVRKVTTETAGIWADDGLTTAIENGYTLVYDEFTRSPPQANNPLLIALEERMLILPAHSRGAAYVRAHPEFRAIFTSNPEDYAAVSRPQDALLDRMITFDLDFHDRQTEIGIVATRSGLSPEVCGPIVDIVRKMRSDGASNQHVSVRAAIMIARVVQATGMAVSHTNPDFNQLCIDVLESKAAKARVVQESLAAPARAATKTVSGTPRTDAADVTRPAAA